MYYISKTAKKGTNVLRISTAIPVIRIDIRSNIDLVRYPLNEPTLNRNSKRVTVKQLEEIRDFELGTTEVIEQHDRLTVITVKPPRTRVNPYIVWVCVIPDGSRLTSPRSTMIYNHARRIRNRPGFTSLQTISLYTPLILDKRPKVLISDLTETLSIL